MFLWTSTSENLELRNLASSPFELSWHLELELIQLVSKLQLHLAPLHLVAQLDLVPRTRLWQCSSVGAPT